MRRALACAIALAIALFAMPGSAGSFSNGHLPDSALAPAAQGGCVQLARPAAKAWNNFQLDAGRVLPANGCASAYRTFAQQVELRRFWCNLGKCGNAAIPGTSNHGWGLAIDVDQSTRAQVDRTGAGFGWCKIPRRIGQVDCLSDAAHEWWHIRYTFGVFSGRRNPCPVREGDTDPCVRGLKRRLRAHGETGFKPGPHLGASGRRALVHFQTSHKLAADGVPGPATWKQLYRKAPPAKPPTPLPSPHPQPGPIIPPPPKPEPSRPAKCIDVSKHQGSIDWDAVDKAGYDCAWEKASEGQDFRDPTFSAARVSSSRAELGRIGSYHYLRPRPGRSGAAEARWYVKVSRAAGIDWRKGHDLRPVLDVEETALATPAANCRYLKQAVAEIHRLTGRRTLVYTFPSFGNRWLSCTSWVNKARAALWIAHVGVTRPVIPLAWTGRGYTVWQHSWKGRVAGVPGDVDLNITTTRALRALAAR